MSKFILFLDAASGTVSGGGDVSTATGFFQNGSWISIAMLVLLFGVFYFFMIRPQNKQQKELRAMRNSLSIGDVVTTSGGIIGRVKLIKDDNVTIESAGQKMLIHRWAISTIDQKIEEVDEEDDD